MATPESVASTKKRRTLISLPLNAMDLKFLGYQECKRWKICLEELKTRIIISLSESLF